MMPKSNQRLVPLLGAVFAVVMCGCGRTGVSMRSSENGASLTTGGGGGGDSEPSGSRSTSSQGGAIATSSGSSLGSLTSSAGSITRVSNSLGGVTDSAGNRTSLSEGGARGGANSGGAASVSSWAGSGGWAGTGSQGGSKSSGGSSATKNATIVPPREPASHRAKAPSCVFARRAEPINATDAGVGTDAGVVLDGNCKKHADCVFRPNGECVNVSEIGIGRRLPAYYGCVYTLCGTDADCTESEVCDCKDGAPGTCVGFGNCRVDADCGGGAYSYCSRAYGTDCGGYHAPGRYYCHTPKDTCITDGDCTGKDYRDYCDYEVITGRWECKSPNMSCAIG